MIGTQEDAERAVSGHLTTFGYGSSRNCYRVGDVIYKVNRHKAWNANEDEWLKYQQIVDMVRDEAIIRVPETRLIETISGPVIAMQYINGQPMNECWCIEDKEPHSEECLPKEMVEPLQRLITDLGGKNVIFDGALYWIIDLGECI